MLYFTPETLHPTWYSCVSLKLSALVCTILYPPPSLSLHARGVSNIQLRLCVRFQEKFERIASTRRRQKEQHKRFLAALRDKRVQEEVRRERLT